MPSASNPRPSRPNGYVVTALQAAYSSIVHTPIPTDMPCRHLQDALKTAIRVGNDTDTVAAIAGSLLGAGWGASAIPAAWRSLLHGWPGYRARDLVRLALATVNVRSDPDAWPMLPSMLEYYRSNFTNVRDAVMPLPDDPGVLVGDVGALETVGEEADVVVSLCRVGWNDVPADTEHIEVWLIDTSDAAENPNLDFVLTDTVSAIAEARRAGKTVFLHCVATESRTPTVAAGYLAQHLDVTGDQAFAKVQEVLPQAKPNSSFASALGRLWP